MFFVVKEGGRDKKSGFFSLPLQKAKERLNASLFSHFAEQRMLPIDELVTHSVGRHFPVCNGRQGNLWLSNHFKEQLSVALVSIQVRMIKVAIQ